MYCVPKTLHGQNKVKFLMENFRKKVILMLLLNFIGKEMLTEFIKMEFYNKQKFNAINKFIDLYYDYLELSLGFKKVF